MSSVLAKATAIIYGRPGRSLKLVAVEDTWVAGALAEILAAEGKKAALLNSHGYTLAGYKHREEESFVPTTGLYQRFMKAAKKAKEEYAVVEVFEPAKVLPTEKWAHQVVMKAEMEPIRVQKYNKGTELTLRIGNDRLELASLLTGDKGIERMIIAAENALKLGLSLPAIAEGMAEYEG